MRSKQILHCYQLIRSIRKRLAHFAKEISRGAGPGRGKKGRNDDVELLAGQTPI